MIEGPFNGSDAIRAGLVRKHELRSTYSAMFPDVYAPKGIQLTVRQRAVAAWLWSGRGATIMGFSAAGLHGAKWLDVDLPIELIWSNARPPRGLRTAHLQIDPSERMLLGGLTVTTAQRTTFDIGRRHPTGPTVARMDALLRATGISVDEVEALLRLILVEAGLPRPCTQIPVRSSDGWSTYYLDMGWEDIKVAV